MSEERIDAEAEFHDLTENMRERWPRLLERIAKDYSGMVNGTLEEAATRDKPGAVQKQDDASEEEKRKRAEELRRIRKARNADAKVVLQHLEASFRMAMKLGFELLPAKKKLRLETPEEVQERLDTGRYRK